MTKTVKVISSSIHLQRLYDYDRSRGELWPEHEPLPIPKEIAQGNIEKEACLIAR